MGRIGVLAVALGIGGAILAAPGVAGADTGGTSVASSTDSASEPATRPSRSARRGAANRASKASPTTPATGIRDRRGSAKPTSPATATAAAKPNQDPQPAATSSAPPISVPNATPSRVTLTPTSLFEVDTVADQANGALPQPAAVQAAAPAIVPSSPVTPVMTAATSRAALSAAGGSLLSWLGGANDPSGPVAAPIGWAALAVSRREVSGNSSAAATAASVTTGQPADATATGPLSQPGVVTALLGAAKQVILAVAGGSNLGPALQGAMASLDAEPALANISLESVLSDPGLPQSLGTTTAALVTGLAADPAVRQAVGDMLSESVAAALGHTAVAETIGTTLGDALVGLLADPAAANALGEVADSFVSVALNQPGVVAAATDIARQLYAGLSGADPSGALDAAWSALEADPAFRSALGVAVSTAVNVGLTDAVLLAALSNGVTDMISTAAGDPALQTFVGQQLSGYVDSLLPGNPELTTAVGDVVVALMSNSVVVDGVAAVAGSALTGFLSQSGVAAALSTAAGQLATAVVAGADPTAALEWAWYAVQGNSAVTSALAGTLGDAVTAILSDSGVISELASTASSLAGLVAGVPDIGTAIEGLLGPTYSAVILDMLADPTATEQLATLAGSLVTTFLAQPGVVESLAAAASQMVTTALAGSDVAVRLFSTLGSLEADSAVLAAFDATVSSALGSLLSDAGIQDTVSELARKAVEEFVAGALNDSPLTGVAVNVASAAVDSLLANSAVQDLISTLGGDIVGGTPIGELTQSVIASVVTDRALQAAVGMAVGAGIGALFGDNLVGTIVSKVVGSTATALIGVVSGIAKLLNGFTGVLPGAAAATDSGSRSSYLLIV